mmetsp:Transcript_57394/g.186443  ORF Transcript_57394/g.186443 Transcript_57394/m.186443 type:complete len:251 (-) Transcript_57394:668-1420(-)
MPSASTRAHHLSRSIFSKLRWCTSRESTSPSKHFLSAALLSTRTTLASSPTMSFGTHRMLSPTSHLRRRVRRRLSSTSRGSTICTRTRRSTLPTAASAMAEATWAVAGLRSSSPATAATACAGSSNLPISPTRRCPATASRPPSAVRRGGRALSVVANSEIKSSGCRRERSLWSSLLPGLPSSWGWTTSSKRTGPPRPRCTPVCIRPSRCCMRDRCKPVPSSSARTFWLRLHRGCTTCAPPPRSARCLQC